MTSHRRNDVLIPALGVLFDALAIEASFLTAYWVRFHTDLLSFLPLTEATPPLNAYILSSLIVIPVWLLIFDAGKMYGARRNVQTSDEFVNIIKLVTLGMLIMMSAAFFYREFSYSRVVFGLLWVTSCAFLFIGRVTLLQIERSLYASGKELRNAVIIGNNDVALRIYNSIYDHPLLGYKLVGYLADGRATEGPLAKANYLGGFDQAVEQLSVSNIELALIALDHHEYQKLHQLVRECEGMNIEFMLVPDILKIMASNLQVREIEGIPFIKLKGVAMTTWGSVGKRLFDLIVSTITLLVLSPLMLMIALAIRLESKGSVFFRQERIGLDGNRFMMLKFRSMTAGAERFDHTAGLGIQNDPRQTGVGRFLRRTSLDEFPQLLNVLKGEMSLVGPRPERPYYVDQFKHHVPKYLDRHRVKTGMTGWAQVNGLRGDSSLEERIRYDLYYIENWSFGFDLKILFKTIGALFSSR